MIRGRHPRRSPHGDPLPGAGPEGPDDSPSCSCQAAWHHANAGKSSGWTVRGLRQRARRAGRRARRETQTYESILEAIAEGHHTPQEIGAQLELTSGYLGPYLKQLVALHLVERRLPVTLPREKASSSRDGRYRLCDAYLRFYFRFIAPNLTIVEQEQTDLLWERIAEQLRAFVGVTAFEEISRDWVRAMGRRRRLSMTPENVGSHWSGGEQIDVVGINWRDRTMLAGECKWGGEKVGRGVVTELVEKAARARPDERFKLSYVVFARSGFTDAAKTEAKSREVLLVDAETMERDLREIDSGP